MSYPESERLKDVGEQADTIHEFLDWLSSQGVWLGRYVNPDSGLESERLYVYHISHQNLVYQYFDIDGKKVEAERRAMLKEYRST